MNIIFRLSSALLERKNSSKSFFYRNRHLLEAPCKQISLQALLTHPEAKTLLSELSKFAPLQALDLSDNTRAQLLQDWNKTFPQDKKFYQMMKQQLEIWEGFSDKPLQEFIESPEGKTWYEKRRGLKRPAVFELDMPFKKTKQSALINSEKIRSIIRSFPLIRYEDLKELGLKNLQPVFENFPQRELHRTRYLTEISRGIQNQRGRLG